MKIVASTLHTFDVQRLILSNLSGVERKCAVCHRAFEDKDEVIVLAKSKYEDDFRQVGVISDDVFIVHLKGKEQGTCLEDFIATLLTSKELSTPA